MQFKIDIYFDRIRMKKIYL